MPSDAVVVQCVIQTKINAWGYYLCVVQTFGYVHVNVHVNVHV